MVSFYVYDIAILIIFSVILLIFFKRNKKNLKKESIFIMYRSQAGINIINYIGNNFKRTLHILKYPIIAIGILLTGILLLMLGNAFYRYAVTPKIAELIPIPPIAPLIPYFPEIFGVQGFFPNLYFVYFALALAIVMIVHEFSHGIYMKLFKIKIKSTGLIFGWIIYTWIFLSFTRYFEKITKNKTHAIVASVISCLLVISVLAVYTFSRNSKTLFLLIILLFPLLGAFVEEEKKQFKKKKNIEQMSVLGAGVFANIITGLFFLGILLILYNIGYNQGGYAFNSYSFEYLSSNEDINFEDSFEGTILLKGFERKTILTRINVNGENYLITSEIKKALEEEETNKDYLFLAFHDSPALKNHLQGGIIQVDGEKINGEEDLKEVFSKKIPGQGITIQTNLKGEIITSNLILEEHPLNSSKPFLGISFISQKTSMKTNIFSRIIGKISESYQYINNPEIRNEGDFYVPSSNKITFVYYLLFWIVVINFLVAIFNMIPFGPFDGGRFFFLGVQSITGSERIAKWTSRILGYLILLGILFITFIWATGGRFPLF